METDGDGLILWWKMEECYDVLDMINMTVLDQKIRRFLLLARKDSDREMVTWRIYLLASRIFKTESSL